MSTVVLEIVKKGKHMKYKRFKEELKKEVEREVRTGAEVLFQEIARNNQIKQDGIVVKWKGSNVSAILSLEDLYERYQESGSMEQTVSKALKMLEEKPKIPEENLPKTWKEVRRNIQAELVHYDWNQEILRNLPHRRFLNFAVTYQMKVSVSEEYKAKIRVNHRLMELWGIKEEELYEAAIENLKSEPYQIQPMSKLFGTGVKFPEDMPEEYVLSNIRFCYGAAEMLREDILEKFSRKIGGNFYILPSSVHELILVPESAYICTEYLREMVKEVNESVLIKEEWLSEDVYYYDSEKNNIEIVT